MNAGMLQECISGALQGWWSLSLGGWMSGWLLVYWGARCILGRLGDDDQKHDHLDDNHYSD